MSRQRVDPLSKSERWARRFRVASVAFIASAVLAVATPLASDPGARAGVVRRVRMVQSRLTSLPRATARLDVPFLRQERSLSCEAATLRMALAYRGVRIPERELLAAIGVDPTPRSGNVWVARTAEPTAVWGDPDEAFVGNVDGLMPKTGYGVHAAPIARVAGQHRRAEVVIGGTAQLLAREIAQGNPVIAWGFVPGRGKPLAWRTLGGAEVRTVDGEHTRVVIGYTGTVEEPTGFHVMDPIYGEQYWKTERFMENWKPLGSMGVIIQ